MSKGKIGSSFSEFQEEIGEIYNPRNHDQLPWKSYSWRNNNGILFSGVRTVLDSGSDIFICPDITQSPDRSEEQTLANIKFICNAANNHYKLIDALEYAVTEISNFYKSVEIGEINYQISLGQISALKSIVETLKGIRGQ